MNIVCGLHSPRQGWPWYVFTVSVRLCVCQQNIFKKLTNFDDIFPGVGYVTDVHRA